MGSSTRAGISAPIYRASKAAATNLARSLSMELAADNIAVGAWHPGWVQTDMGGSEAAITPQTSAAGLLSRFDALSMQTTGVFEDYAGTPHPF
jgi:NAD(P)-dependent dehydrogenase (short-subunit alcohol dehydrogenase family)